MASELLRNAVMDKDQMSDRAMHLQQKIGEINRVGNAGVTLKRLRELQIEQLNLKRELRSLQRKLREGN